MKTTTSQPNATRRAILEFTQHDTGPYAGKWVIVGRRGQVRPKLEGEARHGKTPWTVSVGERAISNGRVQTVAVEVPWRLSSEPLTDQEVARVLDLAREQIGEFTVID